MSSSERLEDAVFAVRDGAKTVGTAWLVSSDMLVTCAHVVPTGPKEVRDSDPVVVDVIDPDEQPRRAELLEYDFDLQAGRDFALLRLSDLEEHEVRRFAESALPYSFSRDFRVREFQSCGYGGPDRTRVPTTGKITGSTNAPIGQNLLFELETGSVEAGFSGAPVFSVKDNAVIGVLHGARAGTVLATPLYLARAFLIQRWTVTASAFPSSAELVLRDESLSLIGRGVGSLELQVPAGHYVLQARIGARVKEQIVSVKDAGVECTLRVEIPSATPTDGTSTVVRSHAQAAERISHEPSDSIGSGSGRLMLMVRDLPNVKGPPIRPEDLTGVTLRDSNGLARVADVAAVVDSVRSKSQNDSYETEGWLAFSIDLPPDGYVLRWPVLGESGFGGSEALEQPLFIPPPGDTRHRGELRWIVCVFLYRNPADGRLLHESTRIHLAPQPEGFSAENPEAVEVNLALESALTAVERREPASVVDLTRDEMRLLLAEKFTNPMLGIVGAHALLLRPSVNWSTFDIVLENLSRLVPGHPDVEALRAIGNHRRGDGDTDVVITSPPMLASAYHSLVGQAWDQRGLIEPDSLADGIAGRLINCGPWTMWTCTSELWERDTVKLTGRAVKAGGKGGSRRGSGDLGEPGPSEIDPALLERAELWITEARRWAEDESGIGPEHLGHALGLPPAAAEKVFAQIDFPHDL